MTQPRYFSDEHGPAWLAEDDPNDMTHTQLDESDVMGSLNLSDQDWDNLPDRVRAALARLTEDNADLLSALRQAVDESGHYISGPTDWRAAEDGEPKWVCNARAAIARATE